MQTTKPVVTATHLTPGIGAAIDVDAGALVSSELAPFIRAVPSTAAA